jgi:hypothetical protein
LHLALKNIVLAIAFAIALSIALVTVFLFFFAIILVGVFYIKIYQVRLIAWRYYI